MQTVMVIIIGYFLFNICLIIWQSKFKKFDFEETATYPYECYDSWLDSEEREESKKKYKQNKRYVFMLAYHIWEYFYIENYYGRILDSRFDNSSYKILFEPVIKHKQILQEEMIEEQTKIKDEINSDLLIDLFLGGILFVVGVFMNLIDFIKRRIRNFILYFIIGEKNGNNKKNR